MKYEDGKAVSTWPSRPRNAWLTLMPIAGMALEIAAAQPALGARLIAASHGSAENRPASTEAVASPSKQDPASEIARGGSRLWYPVAEDSLATPAPTSGRIVAQRYRTLRLDHSGLINVLARAPLERTDEARDVEVVMELPWPDGRFRSFRIEESPIMEPELAAQFPEMKTYRGQGINDGTASVRFDWTPTGFHALVLSGEGEVLIDPHSPGDTQNYIVYYRRDYKRRGTFHCTVVDNELRGRTEGDAAAGPDQPQHGATLRTYRIAVAATGEYTASHGGTVAGAMNGIVTTMNRVNGIYERDLAVRMNLIGSNSSIVYTDPSTDPYTNADTSAMLCENARNLDAVIGVGSYDVGHVFSTAPGGRASAGVCSAVNACGSPSGSVKGQGASGLQIPLQDAFDVDVVAHEIGHQFGATHTFNGTTGTSCANGRFASTAFEPGSGSTILAYPGLCGAENIQANSDAYFHAGSQDQIITFITNAATGGSCDVESATSNAAPTANAGPDYTVPRGTPFILTASGIDTKGTYLNYAWEEMDLGTASPPHTDDGSRPLFRSFPPSASPSRTFPRLSDILNNTTTFGESLPTTTRSMNFRVTLRQPVGGRWDRLGRHGLECPGR